MKQQLAVAMVSSTGLLVRLLQTSRSLVMAQSLVGSKVHLGECSVLHSPGDSALVLLWTAKLLQEVSFVATPE